MTYSLPLPPAINLLTASVVQAAAHEIQTGTHIQLDWPLHNVQFPGFSRKPFSQTKIDLQELGLGFAAMDDEIYINTQAGSQCSRMVLPGKWRK